MVFSKNGFLDRKCKTADKGNTQLSEFCDCRSALIIPPSKRNTEAQFRAAACLAKRKEVHKRNKQCKTIVGRIRSNEDVTAEERNFAKDECNYKEKAGNEIPKYAQVNSKRKLSENGDSGLESDTRVLGKCQF